MSSVAEFWDLLQGARGTQSYEFSCLLAQFLLCPQLLRPKNQKNSLMGMLGNKNSTFHSGP